MILNRPGARTLLGRVLALGAHFNRYEPRAYQITAAYKGAVELFGDRHAVLTLPTGR